MDADPGPPPAPAPLPPEGAARLFEEAASEAVPGDRPPPPPPAEIAPLFPDLEILGVLGAGGMGVVYRARHRRLERMVALKVLPRELAKDPQFVERFAREARTLARLDHPRIVRVHDFGETGGLCYLVLEHVDGPNLRQVMAAGRLRPSEALAIVPQICEALQYAHDRGVVHRDVKPENVLLDAEGHVKIADFGLAKIVGRSAAAPTLTGTGQVMGTYQYMAPEQVRTPQDVDHRADLYSLGVVFYEMLTGELPMGRFEPPSDAAGLDARIDRIVLHALERERERRYQRAEEIRTDVTGLSTSPPVAAGPPRGSGKGAPAHLGERLALVLAALALPLGAVVVAFLHELWGGVERGTSDAANREIWKGLVGGAVFAFGALEGILAAMRSASAGAPRWIRRAGTTLALLNVAAIVALVAIVGVEVARHSRTNARAAAVPASVTRGVAEAWERLQRRIREEGATPLAIMGEYARADRARVLAARPGVYGEGIGPVLLALGGHGAGYAVTRIEPAVEPGRLWVSVAQRAPDGGEANVLRFPMAWDEGEWRFAAGVVERLRWGS